MAKYDPEAFSPDYMPPPGETIAELLEEQEMTQTELARRLGVSLKHLNQVIKGSATISAELALGLEKVFSAPANFWLAREAIFRTHEARLEEGPDLEKALGWAEQFPLKELQKRGLIPRQAKGDKLVAALLQFLGIASPKQWESPAVAYRKSQKLQSDEHALAAWLRIGELEGKDIECKTFDADRFRDALEHARGLTRLPVSEWQPKLVDLCADAGVAVAIVEHFKAAKVNGATRWLSPGKALIQLSIRYRWEDIFWFTFFHEAGHVLLHQKKEVFVEPEKQPKVGSIDPKLLELENEANRFAGRMLIPSRFEARLKTMQLGEVPAFAEHLGIAPAIVVGRLHHDNCLDWSKGNHLRRRLQFVET
ncbi:MAG TPA: HigA family addiction module antitoxin [Solirubrobacterales bacterium]|jgi:addiction module HigA family antidote|nr:HigA family addiction module antitoxin [Solirubrobacterales bacterium]